jgi:hypothetical protein
LLPSVAQPLAGTALGMLLSAEEVAPVLLSAKVLPAQAQLESPQQPRKESAVGILGS